VIKKTLIWQNIIHSTKVKLALDEIFLDKIHLLRDIGLYTVTQFAIQPIISILCNAIFICSCGVCSHIAINWRRMFYEEAD